MFFDIYTLTAATYRLLISKSQYELGQISKEEFEQELEVHEEIYDGFMKDITAMSKAVSKNRKEAQ